MRPTAPRYRHPRRSLHTSPNPLLSPNHALIFALPTTVTQGDLQLGYPPIPHISRFIAVMLYMVQSAIYHVKRDLKKKIY